MTGRARQLLWVACVATLVIGIAAFQVLPDTLLSREMNQSGFQFFPRGNASFDVTGYIRLSHPYPLLPEDVITIANSTIQIHGSSSRDVFRDVQLYMYHTNGTLSNILWIVFGNVSAVEVASGSPQGSIKVLSPNPQSDYVFGGSLRFINPDGRFEQFDLTEVAKIHGAGFEAKLSLDTSKWFLRFAIITVVVGALSIFIGLLNYIGRGAAQQNRQVNGPPGGVTPTDTPPGQGIAAQTQNAQQVRSKIELQKEVKKLAKQASKLRDFEIPPQAYSPNELRYMLVHLKMRDELGVRKAIPPVVAMFIPTTVAFLQAQPNSNNWWTLLKIFVLLFIAIEGMVIWDVIKGSADRKLVLIIEHHLLRYHGKKTPRKHISKGART